MNEKNREALSAFLDGELSDPETIESLVRQSGCNKAFGALCEQRDALHGQINKQLPAGFADSVAQAIAAEPTVLCPAAGRTAAAPSAAPVSDNVVQGWFGGRVPSMAIAASVAAIGFAGLVMFSESAKQPDHTIVAQPVLPSQAAPALAVAPDLSVRQDAVRPVTSDVRSIDFNALSPQLRDQLIRHIERGGAAQLSVGVTQPSNISYQPGN